MQKLAELCIRLPVFASMIVLSIVVIGATSYFQLDIDKHPEVELPTVSVRTNLPGASPEEVEVSITQIIEEDRDVAMHSPFTSFTSATIQ